MGAHYTKLLFKNLARLEINFPPYFELPPIALNELLVPQ